MFHLARTLCPVGLLQQDPESKVYRLGLKAFQVGQAALHHLGLPRVAEPPLRELAHGAGESTSLVQYDGGAPVYVVHVEASRAIGLD